MHEVKAFRCNGCGFLEVSDHAAEDEKPHACRVCGKGVKFTEQGIKTFQPDNWEVLADAAPERLTELGLTPAQVEKHVKWTKVESVKRDPVYLKREAMEVTITNDVGG